MIRRRKPKASIDTSRRYYVQALPFSIRRYDDAGMRERWITSISKWVPECCPEQGCIQTEDEKVDEATIVERYASVIV